MIPEDCILFKQVLDVGRSLGIEPTPEFERALLYFAYQCQLKMHERIQKEMLNPMPPIIVVPRK